MIMVKLLMVGLLGAGWSAFAADSDIEREINSSYVYRAALSETVTVSAQNGAVTLVGSVPNENFKALAADVAGAVPGAGRVDNRLSVQAPAAEGSDAAIKTALQSRFLLGRNIGAAGIRIAVAQGVVTLTGTADNLVEMNLAGIYAKETPGVKDVRNELKVSDGATSAPVKTVGTVDDASLLALVKFALRSHQSTASLQPKVVAKDAQVTIEGEARSTPMKNFIGLLAETLRGVDRVTNNLTATGG